MKPVFGVFALLTYACLIAWASLSPGSGAEPYFPHDDKLIHFLAYALFALLSLPVINTYAHVYIVSACIFLFGGLIEIGQSFVPLREMSFGDLMANTLGLVVGMWAALKLRPRLLKAS